MNFSGKITRVFLYNPSLSLLSIFGVIFLGLFGYINTPKQYNPEVTLPAFSLQTHYAGATAKEVETLLTREIEEKISEIPGVEKISSQSIDGGTSLVRVEFFVGEDLETAKTKVFSKVYENLDTKESNNISDPIIKNISPDNVAIGIFALQSSTLSQNTLREKAFLLTEDLQSISGIANIEIFGGEEKSLNITLNPLRLKEYNLTLREVKNAIMLNNGRALLGDLTDSKKRYQIEINTKISTAEKAKKILIAPGILLGDIADVKEGYREKISHTTFLTKKNNKNTVFVSFAKQKNKNTSDIMKKAKKRMRNLEQNLQNSVTEDIQIQVVRDTAKIANNAISTLGINLIQSISIVFFTLLLFLGGRSALLVALAIPLTLLFVFFAGYSFEQTINKVTLFALILSLGLLVDAATVVVENIHRHLKEQSENSKNKNISEEEQKEIIINAVNEVGIGLFLSTLTSIIVFLPMTQISGMMGSYMGPLSFFVPMALFLSLCIAYSITPYLAFLLFKNNERKKPSLFDTVLSSFSLHKILESIQEKYARGIRYILGNRLFQNILLSIVFGGLFLSFFLIFFEKVHFQMLPKSDNKTFWITLDFPEGTDEPIVYDISQIFAKSILQKDSLSQHQNDIESIQIFSGTEPIVDFNGLFREFSQRGKPHQSSLLVTLSDNRKYSSEKNAEFTRKKLTSLQKKISEAEEIEFIFRVVEDPPGPPVQATLVAKIKGGSSSEVQTRIVQKIKTIFQETAGVVDIDTSQEDVYEKTIFHINTEKAKANNISNKDIYDTLSISTSPSIVGEFYTEDRITTATIELKTEKKFRTSLNDLKNIFLKSKNGTLIPLESVLEQITTESIPSRFRDEHISTQYITAEMENRSVIYAVKDIVFEIFKEYDVKSFSLYGIDIQEKLSGEVLRLEWGGEFEMTLDNFLDLGIAMTLAFIFVYAILVGQFSSFITPLLIMATVPLALLGILPGFAILDTFYDIPLTATALIGFIALLGIVVNNAIIYLEYLQQLQKNNRELLEAVILAGKMRIQPIVLTSLTTILGSLTIAGDPVWSGLAWSIVFGLSLSTFLTLGIFPILYFRHHSKNLA